MSEAVAAQPIAFIDLQAQRARIDDALRARVDDVLAHGRFILGPEVTELEGRLAEFAGADYAVCCANGTDALLLSLRALGVGPGRAVLVPSFTFCATAEAVVLCGATPVFVDVEPFWQFISVGVVIILSVLIDQAQRQFSGSRQDES